jgi:LCP family protein required for cell wall assembly
LAISDMPTPVVFAAWIDGRPAGVLVARGRPRVPHRSAAHATFYAVACVFSALVLAASGFSYFVVRDVSSIGASHAISGGPSIGAQNILLMGLESRRDWNGNVLPSSVLKALHAGSRQGVENGIGGNDTNTLILIHIPAGGKKAIGFSIPRDDWVTFGGTVGPQQHGKIDQAYGVSMFYRQAELRKQQPDLSQNQLAFAGNEAGRKAAVDTVEQLTGVHIDHFAEVNLDGFYELARVLGGVQVCLNHAVSDRYSGAHFHAGYQHVNASQALAFVRQRHGLTNGDLDRTHRQQAFLDSVMAQLRSQGVFGDLTKLQALLSVAKKYAITDSGWDLLQFSTQMSSLTGGHLVFHTLPIEGYATIAGQSANQIDPAKIKTIVQSAFYPQPPAARTSGPARTAKPAPGTAAASTVVDVLNGGQTGGLARQVSAAVVQAGYQAGLVQNTTPLAATQVVYGAGEAANATALAGAFGVTATASPAVTAHHIQIRIGAATTTVPAIPSGRASTQPPSSQAPASPAIPTTGAQGGAVGGQNGIPCVN